LCAASLAVGSRAICAQALPAQRLTVGMILPRENGSLIEDVTAGIELGFEEAVRSSALFQKTVFLVRAFFTSPQGAASAARDLAADDHATILVGGGSDDECRAIAAECIKRGAIFMNTVSRSDDLRRTNCTNLVVHVEASDAMYASAGKNTIGQATTSTSSGCDIVLWHSSLERYGAAQLNDRFEAKFHKPMTGSSWAGWMAVKAASEAFFRAGTSDGTTLAAYLGRGMTQFDGHKGAPLSFRSWDHQLRQPLYCVEKTVAGATLVRDVPDLARSSGPARALLDEIGDDSSHVACRDAVR